MPVILMRKNMGEKMANKLVRLVHRLTVLSAFNPQFLHPLSQFSIVTQLSLKGDTAELNIRLPGSENMEISFNASMFNCYFLMPLHFNVIGRDVKHITSFNPTRERLER